MGASGRDLHSHGPSTPSFEGGAMTRSADWHFDKGIYGSWRWNYVEPTTGSVTMCSTRPFTSLVQCMSDAMRHGCRSPSTSTRNEMRAF